MKHIDELKKIVYTADATKDVKVPYSFLVDLLHDITNITSKVESVTEQLGSITADASH